MYSSVGGGDDLEEEGAYLITDLSESRGPSQKVG